MRLRRGLGWAAGLGLLCLCLTGPRPTWTAPCKQEAVGYVTECVSGGCFCSCDMGYGNVGGLFALCVMCDPGTYKSWRGFSTCTSCEKSLEACGDFSYLEECGFDSPGICKLCTECPAGTWMSSCNTSGLGGRVCTSCREEERCLPHEVLEGCYAGSPGKCVPNKCPPGYKYGYRSCYKCNDCPAGQFVLNCTETITTCGFCNPLAVAFDEYLHGCGNMSQGEIRKCKPCGDGACACHILFFFLPYPCHPFSDRFFPQGVHVQWHVRLPRVRRVQVQGGPVPHRLPEHQPGVLYRLRLVAADVPGGVLSGQVRGAAAGHMRALCRGVWRGEVPGRVREAL